MLKRELITQWPYETKEVQIELEYIQIVTSCVLGVKGIERVVA